MTPVSICWNDALIVFAIEKVAITKISSNETSNNGASS